MIPPLYSKAGRSEIKNLNPHYDDCYFTPNEGMEESRYVFFNGNNLPSRLSQCLTASNSSFTIVETGFGSGLNIYLTAALACKMNLTGMLRFYSVEKHPLKPRELGQLLHTAGSAKSDRKILERICAFGSRYTDPLPGWNRQTLYRKNDFCIELELYIGDVLDYLADLKEQEVGADAVFLDGHSPQKNPDMWTTQVFALLSRCLHPGATASTFTASGMVKKGLRKAGFIVKRHPGYGKKRHALIAIRSDSKKS